MKHLILTSLVLLYLTAVGQTKKVVFFYGRGLYEYDHPVQLGNGEYTPYYENMGETFEKGRIIFDSISKSFTIKWLDGEDWIGKYTKVSTIEEVNPTSESKSEITYTGKWSDENILCELTIKKSSDGCVFQVKSGKVIDEDYKINAWKKIFTLFTQGQCLQEQQ